MRNYLNEMFIESLETIGLNSSRYLHLPLGLRKKTLSYDIYNEVVGIFKTDLNFRNKEIYHYSEEEIEKHYKNVSACFSLVCLGNEMYIKPLISYLDFPEPRWTIKINYLLNKIANDETEELTIITYKQKIYWQKLFINRIFYSKIRDLSTQLFDSKTSIDFIKYLHDIKSLSPKKTEISLLNFHNNIQDDLACSEYYYEICFKYLSIEKYNEFVSWFDNSFLGVMVIFFDSIISSIKDVLFDLHISKRFTFWIDKLKKQNVSPLTSILFFKVIEPQTNRRGRRRLANHFVHEFINENLNNYEVSVLSDIYLCEFDTKSVKRISSFLKNYGNLSEELRNNIKNIDPLISYCYKSWLVKLYLSERESLNLIEYPSEEALFEDFKIRYSNNSRMLNNIAGLKSSENAAYIKFGAYIENLVNIRNKFKSKYLIRSQKSFNLKKTYEIYFKNWIDGATRIDKKEEMIFDK